VSGVVLAGHYLRLDERRRRAIGGVLPGICTVMLHSAVLDLPRGDVIDALDADRYRIYWIIGSFLLGGASGMAMTGFWRARCGLRTTYVGALLAFAAAAALCATVESAEAMAPWRLVAGYAMGVVLCAGMLTLWCECPGEEELAMTLYAMGVYLSAFVGVIVGGFVLYRISWQALFLMELPLATAAAMVAFLLLPADAPPRDVARPPFDLAGLAFFVAWVATMIPVVVLGHYWGWLDSPFFVPWGAGFAIASAAFVGWGLLAARPLIDLRPLGDRNFGLGLVVKALFSIDLFVLVSLLSGYMVGARGYQWWQGGSVFLPAFVAMAATMLAGARSGRDRDRKLRIFVGLAVMSAVTWHVGRVDLYTSKTWLALWLGVWGAGAGLAIGPTMLTVFAGLPRETLSHAAGVFNIFRTLPVFAVGTLLVALLTIQQDTHFDRLRLRITYDRPLVAATRTAVARHAAARGGGAASAAQARAVLGRWVRANANAFALGDVLRTLALITASSLLLVPLLRPPPRPTDDDEPPGAELRPAS
jgi:MFS transporter, DHA2 family, multidrug resistance protein